MCRKLSKKLVKIPKVAQSLYCLTITCCIEVIQVVTVSRYDL
jgi:hypothetical protein